MFLHLTKDFHYLVVAAHLWPNSCLFFLPFPISFSFGLFILIGLFFGLCDQTDKLHEFFYLYASEHEVVGQFGLQKMVGLHRSRYLNFPEHVVDKAKGGRWLVANAHLQVGLGQGEVKGRTDLLRKVSVLDCEKVLAEGSVKILQNAVGHLHPPAVLLQSPQTALLLSLPQLLLSPLSHALQLYLAGSVGLLKVQRNNERALALLPERTDQVFDIDSEENDDGSRGDFANVANFDCLCRGQF